MANSGGFEFTTLGAPANTSPIYFVSTCETVHMQISISASAIITWYWGDGVTNSSPSHTFSTAGPYNNYVIVDPAAALTGFGAACQGGASTTLSSVTGLTNYPALQDLYFYETGLTNLSLAGCSNLVYIALVGTSPSSTNENQWFNDLYASEPTMPPGESVLCSDTLHTFYFPASPGTNSTSATACSHLESIGWTLVGY